MSEEEEDPGQQEPEEETEKHFVLFLHALVEEELVYVLFISQPRSGWVLSWVSPLSSLHQKDRVR